MKSIIVIPARLESSRLAGKVLLDLRGKSVIHRVYEQCKKVLNVDTVYIATDSMEIVEHCQKFTENVIMTSDTHNSGTDRIAEAVRDIECDNIINVQGDEPFIEPRLISDMVSALEHNQAMCSAMIKIQKVTDLVNPNVVKVVTNHKNQALYFSRSAIPHHGYDWEALNNHHENIPNGLIFYKHIGIYGYSKEFLLKYSQMESSYLERVEKLEQLRVLENGYSIQMIETEHEGIGIDTIEDYHKALEKIGKYI